jgi:two-component system phosphate regulon sensor histidine kinase PhoR
MAKRRRLLTRLFIFTAGFMALALAAVALFASIHVRRFYLDGVRSELEMQARLAARMLKAADLDRPGDRVDGLCKEIGRKTGTRFTVILASGEVLGDSWEKTSGMGNHADRPEVLAALSGHVGTSTRRSHTLGEDMMYVAVGLEDRGKIIGVVRAAKPVTKINDVTRSLVERIAAAGILAAVLAGLLGWWISRRLGRPLEEMREGASRFAGGDLAHRLPVPDAQELAPLAEAMNAMGEELEGRLGTITRQRNEMEAILASMVESVIVVDEQERVLRINDAAGKLFGIVPDEARGRLIQESVRNAQLHAFISKTLGSGMPVEEDIQVFSGKDRALHAVGTRLRDAASGGEGAVIILHDVTGMKMLESMRRDFVANVSHELKTPITSIKGFVETLKDCSPDDRENTGKFLDIISKHTERLNLLVEDLLNLSRIEQAEDLGDIALERGRVKDVLDSAAAMIAERAGQKNVRITVTCPESITARINAAMLEHAVLNLLDNAVKYSEPGGIVEIAAQRTASEVGIRVKDSGCGIAKEHLPHIFERFYRVDKARSRQLGGTGLGLAIVKHVAIGHGGRVDVESEPGRGSTFTVFLPSA